MVMRIANGWTLFDYQEQGVRHLATQRSRLCGDDMGLGKTLQALVIDRINRMQFKTTPGKKTLIVTKLGVIADDTWQRHIKMVAPDAKVYVYENGKQPAAARKKFIAALKEDYDYYILHWDGARLIKELRYVRWFHIIADEVHKIKNRKAGVSKQFKMIRTTFKTGLSGTPAADKPVDLWSIINWLFPTYYTSFHTFVRHYCLYDEKENPNTGARYRKYKGVQNAKALQEEMSPWFVRRLKVDVLKDLPDKIWTPKWVDLLPVQRTAYDQMARSQMAWLETGTEEGHLMSTAAVIGRLMRLQQFALGYMQPNPKYAPWALQYGAKYEQWKGACRELAKQGYTKEQMPKCPVPLPPPEFLMTEPSAKLDWVMDYLDENDQQLVVFSQFAAPLRLLERRLAEAGITNGIFTGDKKFQEKKDIVRGFQDKKLQVFAGTIKAGGEGIELTSASRMVFLDRSWEPGANNQAEDRLHRIGQKNGVEIMDVMARNTVDLGRFSQVIEKFLWTSHMLGDPIRIQKEMYDLYQKGKAA